MKKKIMIATIPFLLAFFSGTKTASAYATDCTHPMLTINIGDLYGQKFNYLITNANLVQLAEGSKHEDHEDISLDQLLVLRSANHFYDPVYDHGWILDQGIFSLMDDVTPLASPTWALSSEAQLANPKYDGDFSWLACVQKALDNDAIGAFYCLGHLLHLLEDLTVPAHVRDDSHASFTIWEDADGIHKIWGDPYEQWLKADCKAGNLEIQNPFTDNSFPVITITNLAEAMKIAARYTNSHFFSADTINDSRYPLPQISREDAEFSPDGKTMSYAYGTDENGQEYRLARVSIISRWFHDKKVYSLDRACVLDNWKYSSRIAAIYGVALIDFFLRAVEAAKRGCAVDQGIINCRNITLDGGIAFFDGGHDNDFSDGGIVPPDGGISFPGDGGSVRDGGISDGGIVYSDGGIADAGITSLDGGMQDGGISNPDGGASRDGGLNFADGGMSDAGIATFDGGEIDGNFLADGGIDEFCRIGPDNQITDRAAFPSLIWTGSEYGLIWQPNADIYFTRISAIGIKIDPSVRVTFSNAVSVYDPACIVWTGTEYGMIWKDDRNGDKEIYFARISSAGTKIGSDIKISYGLYYFALTWSGSEYGISLINNSSGWPEVYFARVSSAGIKIGRDIRITFSSNATNNSTSLVWADDEYGVSWEQGFEIYFARIAPNGVLLNAPSCIINRNDKLGGNEEPPYQLIWNGYEYGLRWTRNVSGGNGNEKDIYFTRISRDGIKIDSDIRITYNGRASDASLVWTGSEYGLSWQGTEEGSYMQKIYFTRFSPTGIKNGPDIYTGYSGGSFRKNNDLAWTGSEYGLSRQGYPENIIFNRISCQ